MSDRTGLAAALRALDRSLFLVLMSFLKERNPVNDFIKVEAYLVTVEEACIISLLLTLMNIIIECISVSSIILNISFIGTVVPIKEIFNSRVWVGGMEGGALQSV